MANNSLEERLAALYQKRDHIDQFYDEDLKTIVDSIRDAREHGGTASVDITPILGGGGYTITITDSEGTEHTATVKDGGDAYEVYKSTIPSGETPMSKTDWLASLKGADGADGQNGATPTINQITKHWEINGSDTGVLAEGHNHNRGTYNVGDTFPSDGIAGDYIVVVDDTQSTPTAEIYKWDTSQSDWSQTGVSPNDAAFEDGQLLPNTKIDNTQLASPANNALAKAVDVAPLSKKLDGVTYSEVLASLGEEEDYAINGNTGDTYVDSYGKHYSITLSENTKKVRFLAAEVSNIESYPYGYCFYDSNNSPLNKGLYRVNTSTRIAYPIEIEVPENANTIKISTSSVNRTGFYCYLISGEKVVDIIAREKSELAQSIDNIETSLIDHDDIISSVNARTGGGEGNYTAWSYVRAGCVVWSKKWRYDGSYSSYKVSLSQYKNAGYDKIKIKAKTSTETRYSFAKSEVDNLPNLTDVAGMLSSVMENGYSTVSGGSEVVLDIPADAQYLYFAYRYNNPDISYLPSECTIIKTRFVQSIIPKVIDSLESDSANDSLSAKQGKVLVNKINETEVKIVGGEIVTDYGDTISQFTGTHAYINDYGYSWMTSNSYQWSKYATIPATEKHYIRVIANDNYATYITFLRDTQGLTESASSVNYSEIMGAAKRFKIEKGTHKDFLIEDDMNVVFCFEKNMTNYGTETDAFMPNSIQFIDKEVYESMLAGVTLSLEQSQAPAPPRTYNITISEKGEIDKSNDVLTTARVYGDFLVVLNEGYKFNRIIKVDRNGAVLDWNIVIPYPSESDPNRMAPNGIIDGWGAAGRGTYGVCWNQPYYGTIMEITREDGGIISDNENVYKKFYYLDSQLQSELMTQEKYNNNTPDDTNLKYTKESIKAAITRAKIAAMIDWSPVGHIWAVTHDWTFNGTEKRKFKKGDSYLGVPYSRSSVRERWFGIDVSPYTFLTAVQNPYSVIYTEHIGNNSTDAWGTSNDGALYPYHSEYGVTEYSGGHGCTYYGLVCSAYASYVYGFYTAEQTDGFPLDNNRNILISKHKGSGNSYTHTPVIAMNIPPLSTITTPGHTYIVVDFLIDSNGDRQAAIVAEQTTPNIKCGLYPIERLQARFNAEYNYQNTEGRDGVIEVTVVKPSVLDDNATRGLWDVSKLYNIGQTIGLMQPHYHVDPNIMFYMGDKAVVMLYDTTNARKNDKCWLIIKPENIFTHIVIEKYTNHEWVAVEEPISIDDNKESYSDSNTDYFKVDVTSYCNQAGKYRASLTGEDESENTIQTGYTQWIVINVAITVGETQVTWNVTQGTGVIEGDDEFARIVAASSVTPSGGTKPGVNGDKDEEENVSSRYGYINKNVFDGTLPICRVVAMTKWGAASRYRKIYNSNN